MTSCTITDVEIRDLRDLLLAESSNQMTDDTDACGTALLDPDSYPRHLQDVAATMRSAARARCVEILNARSRP